MKYLTKGLFLLIIGCFIQAQQQTMKQSIHDFGFTIKETVQENPNTSGGTAIGFLTGSFLSLYHARNGDLSWNEAVVTSALPVVTTAVGFFLGYIIDKKRTNNANRDVRQTSMHQGKFLNQHCWE